MRFVMFCHSLVSDWNHGNAHFLRGITGALLARGHQVVVYEPADGWSLQNLLAAHGEAPVHAFHARYPRLRSLTYRLDELDLETALADADVVLVHEWNEPALVEALLEHRRRHSYRLVFHDTHHRALSAPAALAAMKPGAFDAVLVFGQVLADLYRARGWSHRVFTWHEAADVEVFHPRLPPLPPAGDESVSDDPIDVAFVGNWGDDERTWELQEFLLGPIGDLRLRAEVYGVRYPPAAEEALARAGIRYCGWLPNFEVPRVFARARLTIHVPRRWYSRALPGIPTIRPFEAMACGVPLLCAPWQDSEGLFQAGSDYLLAHTGAEMRMHIERLLSHPEEAARLAAHARHTVLARHTCGHRVDQMLDILGQCGRAEASAA